jgi:hypothetical protein
MNSTGFLVATLFIVVPNLMGLVKYVILYPLKIFVIGKILLLGAVVLCNCPGSFDCYPGCFLNFFAYIVIVEFFLSVPS